MRTDPKYLLIGDKMARYRARNRDEGLCINCSRKVVEGKMRCEIHLKANVVSVLKSRNSGKESHEAK